MKLFKIFLIVVCTLPFAACRETVVTGKISEDIDSIACKWVPVPEEGLRDFSLVEVSTNRFVLKGETNIEAAKLEIIDYLRSNAIDFTDSVTLLPDPSLNENKWGLITVSVCNMRTNPSHSAEMSTQALMGTPVMILKKDGGWSYIQTPDSYLGWIDNAAITGLSDEEMIEWKNSDRIICTTNYGSITDGQGNIVSDLVYGALLIKTAETGSSYKVVLPDSREGFIDKKDAMDFTSWARNGEPVATDLISFARSLLGSPYLWGGTSTKGIDCSGFVKTIYFSEGIILTRDASSQYLFGSEVEMVNQYNSLVQGDLLFFGSMRDGKKRITHTGMYIGDSEVIHSSGRVRINSLDSIRVNYSEYLSSTLLGAKRFIGAQVEKGNMPVAQHNWYF